MCGLTGFVYQENTSNNLEMTAMVTRMAETLAHRGPDDKGAWVDSEAGVALGHRRLSILDLSVQGHQPMISSTGRYVISYNGEIYNYLDTRKELDSLSTGYPWKGHSDTEVVLASIEHWGLHEALKHFSGMFAIGLWDRQDRTLYLVRDRMGEKPLYYGWAGDCFLFGSELKALRSHPAWKSEIDRDILALYFKYNYVPAPYSIYRGIYKLLPGTILQLNKSALATKALPEPEKYWSLANSVIAGVRDPFVGDDSEAEICLEKYLAKSVAQRMISDVPIGAFLSGGLDSSIIVAFMQNQSTRKVKTYTIGFEDPAYNEAPYAREVARHLQTDHTEMVVTPRECLDSVSLMPKLYDEPFADSSQIPTFLLSSLTRRHVTVCLSGDGGDEIFCGYNRHVRLQYLWNIFGKVPLPLRTALSLLLGIVPSSVYEKALRRRAQGVLADQIQKMASILRCQGPEDMYQTLTIFWEDSDRLVLGAVNKNTLLNNREQWPVLPTFLERIMYVESMTSLPDDMMVKVDRASMGVSLETRMPLVDHSLVEFTGRLPLEMKIRNGKGKWLLRRILSRYIPPSLFERPKRGFGVPIDEWLKGPLKGWAEELLEENRLKKEGYLNSIMVKRKWKEHLDGVMKWQYHLWSVLMFQAWLESQKI